jgi:hypothetical protein
MYMGCRRVKHICTQVVVGTIMYTRVAVEQSMYVHGLSVK